MTIFALLSIIDRQSTLFVTLKAAIYTERHWVWCVVLWSKSARRPGNFLLSTQYRQHLSFQSPPPEIAELLFYSKLIYHCRRPGR